MEKFVKIKSTNTYAEITQATFDADPLLYVDRTDRPVYILNHYAKAGVSYWRARKHVVDYVGSLDGGINDLNDQDKEAAGVFAYGEQMDEMKTFYETFHGDTPEEADVRHLSRVSLNRSLMAADARLIMASPKFIEIGVKYLTVLTDGKLNSEQAFDFSEAMSGYFTEYGRLAVLGIDHGDEHNGIVDYYKSTNAHVGGGLSMYTLNASIVALMPGPSQEEKEDQARAMMIAELDNLFVEGNL